MVRLHPPPELSGRHAVGARVGARHPQSVVGGHHRDRGWRISVLTDPGAGSIPRIALRRRIPGLGAKHEALPSLRLL